MRGADPLLRYARARGGSTRRALLALLLAGSACQLDAPIALDFSDLDAPVPPDTLPVLGHGAVPERYTAEVVPGQVIFKPIPSIDAGQTLTLNAATP